MVALRQINFGRTGAVVEKRKYALGFLKTRFENLLLDQPATDQATAQGDGHGHEVPGDEAGGNRRNERVHPSFFLPKDFGGAQNRGAEVCCHHALQDGKDFVSEPVSRMGGIDIAGVLPPSETMGFCEEGDVRPRDLEEGTDNGERTDLGRRFDPGKASGTGTTQKIEKTGLDLIVRMVGEEKARTTMGSGAAGKEGEPEIPGGQFDRFSRVLGDLGGGGPGGFEG